jgi:NADPH:quinone reductase
VRLYPAGQLVRIPDAISDAQAAASFLRGVTARMLLKETVPLHPGDTVLFHAAAGGIGLLFAQWGRALGIRVIGTVSDDAKAAVARHAGCVEVINYARQDFVERVRAITNGEGVAAAFDAVGRDTFLKSLETLRPRGVLAAFGKASGDPPALDPFLLAPKSLYVTWPIRPVYTATRQQLEASAADLFDAIGQGILDVGPNRTYAFDDIVLAHRDLESRKIVGAAVIKPNAIARSSSSRANVAASGTVHNGPPSRSRDDDSSRSVQPCSWRSPASGSSAPILLRSRIGVPSSAVVMASAYRMPKRMSFAE